MVIFELSFYLILSVFVMTLSFLFGLYFSLRVENTYWDELFSSLNHGEVLVTSMSRRQLFRKWIVKFIDDTPRREIVEFLKIVS